jgi:hypothetical protein
MSAAVAAELSFGASQVTIIGSDSPTLPVEFLCQARSFLGRDAGGVDVVLGPAGDGGYYLIGMRRHLPEPFAAGMPWSTPLVLPMTLERLAESGVRAALLPFFYDCDTPEDLRLLCAHLRYAAQPSAPSALLADPAAASTYEALRELGLL